MSTFFVTFYFLNSKLSFVWFGFCYFLVVFEQISFYFRYNYSDVRIKQNISFRYLNELKIRPQKRIDFMDVDIINRYFLAIGHFVGYCIA
jgi:hypothetical protein